MFKSRNFFIGLGIGFLLSALFLMLSAGSLSKQVQVNDSNTYSLEELKQLAEINDVYIFTEEELNQLKNQIKNDIDEDNIIVENNLETNTSEELAETEESENEEQEKKLDEKKVDFTISSGMDSYETANYLSEIGILKERDIFIKILYNENLTTRILAKSYECSEDISTIELVELITATSREDWKGDY